MYCKNCGEQLNDNTEICPQCGAFTGNGQRFCGNCGNAVSPDAAYCVNCGAALKNGASSATNPAETKKIQPRDLVTAIIFSIITCGIYNIYWFIVLTDEVNSLSHREKDISGALAFILNLLTCGIYGYIWAFQMGQKADQINNSENSYSSIIYIVMIALGLQIVALALIQDTVNKNLERN